MKRSLAPRSLLRTRRKQGGVYAIEFAFVFLALFGLAYTALCYGMLFTYRLGLQSAAEDGARAALRVRALSATTDTQLMQRERAARTAVNLRLDRWFPSAATRNVQACVRKVGQDDTCPVGSTLTPSECGAADLPDVAWTKRCQIVVKITATGLAQVLPPLPNFALPQSLIGQASLLLDGRTL